MHVSVNQSLLRSSMEQEQWTRTIIRTMNRISGFWKCPIYWAWLEHLYNLNISWSWSTNTYVLQSSVCVSAAVCEGHIIKFSICCKMDKPFYMNLAMLGTWFHLNRRSLLKVSHDGMSFEITKLMLIPRNNLCYLIKLLSLFPACVIYSPFVALSIFVVLSNFCRIIKLLPSWDFELFFLVIYISLVISQDIPSCETFSRVL